MTETSHAQELDLHCASCDRDQTVLVWLIVDGRSRLDLVQRIKSGHIHDFLCGECDTWMSVAAPLILHNAESDPPLLFSPVAGSEIELESQREVIGQLTAIFEQRGGTFDGRLGVVPRNKLPDAAVSLLVPEPPAEIAEMVGRIHRIEAKWERSGSLDLMAEAQKMWEALLIEPAFGKASSRFRAATLNDAAHAAMQGYWVLEDWGDLDRAQQLYAAAVEESDEDEFERSMYVNNLALALHNQCKKVWDGERFEHALKLYRQSVEVAHPWSPDWARHCNNLSTGLLDAYLHKKDPEALDEAFSVVDGVLRRSPLPLSDLESEYQNCTAVLLEKFKRDRELPGLDFAISLLRDLPETQPVPKRYWRLGQLMKARYEALFEEQDLSGAIEFFTRASRLISPDSNEFPLVVNDLGAALLSRFQDQGTQQDLSQAMSLLREVSKRVPSTSSSLPLLLSNCAHALYLRYDRDHQRQDLRDAEYIGRSYRVCSFGNSRGAGVCRYDSSYLVQAPSSGRGLGSRPCHQTFVSKRRERWATRSQNGRFPFLFLIGSRPTLSSRQAV